MKKICLFLILTLFFTNSILAQSDSTATADSLKIAQDSIAFLTEIQAVFDKYDLKTTIDSVSYSFGVGVRMTRNMRDIDHLMFMKGYFDNQYDTILLRSFFARTFIRERNNRRRARNNSVAVTSSRPAVTLPHQPISDEALNKLKIKYADSLTVYNQFFKTNGEREKVMTTESGLQYEQIIGGNGARPKLEDKVEIYYVCTDIQGNELTPAKKLTYYQLKSAIKGWQEGIVLMNVGTTYKFYIPYDLAYGAYGVGTFRPFQPLIYTIELVKIVD